MESKIVYFDNPGSINTEQVLHIARQRAEELGIKTLIIASTTGNTAIKAIEVLAGFKLIFVGDPTGYKKPGIQRLTEDNKQVIESSGSIFLISTHVFSGINRAMREKFNTYLTEDIIASTLRIFGQGMKVICEIAMMAADGDLVDADEIVICIAGTQRGADTAVVLKPVNTHKFFDLRIREILCKPHFED